MLHRRARSVAKMATCQQQSRMHPGKQNAIIPDRKIGVTHQSPDHGCIFTAAAVDDMELCNGLEVEGSSLFRSGWESGMARRNPMLDFAPATFVTSSKTRELAKGNSEVLYAILIEFRAYTLRSMGPWQLRNACRCAHQPDNFTTKRCLHKIVLQNRKLCLPSIHTSDSVDIIKSNKKELQPHKPKLVLQTQLTLKASHYQACKQSCNASCV